jgi:hypothetical protein
VIDFDATVLSAAMDAFAEPVTYIPGAGAQIPLVAVFERQHREIKIEGDASEISYRPAVGVRASLLPAKPAENEQFLIRAQYWAVKRVHDDGMGHYTIFLHGPL